MNQNLIKNEIINCNLCPLSKIRSTSVEPVLESVDVLFVSEFFDESFEPLCDGLILVFLSASQSKML